MAALGGKQVAPAAAAPVPAPRDVTVTGGTQAVGGPSQDETTPWNGDTMVPANTIRLK
jgi:hypothetical protein